MIETQLGEAHHALGRVMASRSPDELASAVAQFVAISRELLELLESKPWLGAVLAALRTHPLQSAELGKLTTHKLARGTREIPRVDELYFENLDQQPAIALCADYLERISLLCSRVRGHR